jgi:hypothetical protein
MWPADDLSGQLEVIVKKFDGDLNFVNEVHRNFQEDTASAFDPRGLWTVYHLWDYLNHINIVRTDALEVARRFNFGDDLEVGPEDNREPRNFGVAPVSFSDLVEASRQYLIATPYPKADGKFYSPDNRPAPTQTGFLDPTTGTIGILYLVR